MQLREVMSSPPIFVYPETPLWRAARAMEDNDCSFLPIVENGIALGVITIRNLVEAVALEGHCPFRTTVSEIMSSPAIGLPGTAKLDDATILMRQRNVRRLIVTDERGILRGVVTLGDLAGYLEDDSLKKTIQRLNENSGPGISTPHQVWLPHAHVA